LITPDSDLIVIFANLTLTLRGIHMNLLGKEREKIPSFLRRGLRGG